MFELDFEEKAVNWQAKMFVPFKKLTYSSQMRITFLKLCDLLIIEKVIPDLTLFKSSLWTYILMEPAKSLTCFSLNFLSDIKCFKRKNRYKSAHTKR